MSADAIVARARACMGTRFRAQGRDPGIGLDCLGLVLAAVRQPGALIVAPRDYALNATGLADRAEAGMRAAGGVSVAQAVPGDVLLFEPAPGQAHFGVRTDAGVVQAHLGLGRVVEGPADPAWPVRSIWRFVEGG